MFLNGVDRGDAGLLLRDLLVASGFEVARVEPSELHGSLDVPRSWRMRLTSLAWTAFNVGTGTYDTTVPAKVHWLAVGLEVGAGGTVVRLHGTRYGLRRVLPQIRRLEGGGSTPTRA